MIINGLGFSDRPLTLTPQFFENKALSKLFRPGVNAENFNTFCKKNGKNYGVIDGNDVSITDIFNSTKTAS